MARQMLEVRVCAAWWLAPYLHCLAAVSAITGREPDEEKLSRVIARAITVRAK